MSSVPPPEPSADILTTSDPASSSASAQGSAEPEVPGTSVHLIAGKPLRRYLLWFGIATAAITTIWGGVSGIILPNHVQLLAFGQFFTGADSGVDLQELNQLKSSIDAGTATATAEQSRLLGILRDFDAARASNLALVATIGTVFTMLAQPIIGVLSDRTRSRMGRRAPWILFGGIIGSFLLMSVQFAPSVGILVVLWTVASVALNSAQAPLNATVADRVVEGKRGTASAIGGLGSFAGGILGAVISGVAFGAIGLQSYYVVGGLALIGLVLFVVLVRDRSSLTLEVPAHRWSTFFAGFLVPLRSADFRWVWIARVLLTFGYGTSTALTLYMLQSYVRPALSAAEATSLSPLLAVVGFPGTLVGLIVAGRLSDRLGRRKPFVIFSSVLMAAGFLIPLISPTVPALLISGVVSGVAFGAYLAVDQALFIDVLPDKRAAGRDLGVAAIASNLGQSLAPLIAAQVVVLTAGYAGIWIVAAVLVAMAAVAIVPVKAVR
ncbi:MFS transporter [Naasia lichenicola]|uniref:MFS transporter n=1 Tax=Naasia lichenicola TaxID=2565933 RepID=A0A4S4FLA4_9MICO|nr:MFS transporter [Naasia lichenicola]THG29976.1 MFS transporter [Naasia lichenicola]